MLRPLLISLCLTSTALATTWTVDNNGPSDFNNIQPAVNAASSGDEILVMPGTYTRNNGYVVYIVNKNLSIVSSGGASVTFIEGENKNMCVFLDNSDCTIDGFSIVNGNSQLTGGVFVYGSDAVIKNCIINNNHATGSYSNLVAGGIYTSAANVSIYDSEISNNTSSVTGGLFLGGTSALYNCVVSGNTGGVFAGGITVLQGDVSINACTIELNEGFRAGGVYTDAGGILVLIDGVMVLHDAAQLTLTDCQVSGNTNSGAEHKEILAAKNAKLVMQGNNTVNSTYVEDAGSSAAFMADSVCEMTGPFSPTNESTVIIDINAEGADAPLQINGTLRKDGCLSITNESGSLSTAQLGQKFPVYEFSKTEDFGASFTFPVMPDGLGLQFIAHPINGGEATRVKVKVIEVEDAEFNEPLSADLTGDSVGLIAFDADNDGNDEVAILYDGSPGAVGVYKISDVGNAPTEIVGFSASVGNNPSDIDTGDFNNDGLADLLIANEDDDSITVLLTVNNGGILSFTSSTIPIPGSLQTVKCVAVVNWDGDSKLDAVIGVETNATNNPDGYRIIRNISSNAPIVGPWIEIPDYEIALGTFSSDSPTAIDGLQGINAAWGFVGGTEYGRIHHVFPAPEPTLLVVSELGGNEVTVIQAIDLDDNDGDGQVDLLVGSYDAQSLYIFQGDAKEADQFGEAIPLYVSTPILDVIVIDANNDGDKDFVIAANDTARPLLLLRNDGLQGLLRDPLEDRGWSQQDMDAENEVGALSSGDLVGKDEDDDWIVKTTKPATLQGGLQNFLEQTNLFIPCPADVTGDGEVSIADLLVFIAAWGVCEGCDEDLNGDGEVNIADLLIVIANWGPCA
jgi:hypothetical protein